MNDEITQADVDAAMKRAEQATRDAQTPISFTALAVALAIPVIVLLVVELWPLVK